MDKFELYVYKSSLTCMYPALLEHGSRMESCEISECLWENSQVFLSCDKSFDLSFFKNYTIVLGKGFVIPHSRWSV